MIFGNQFKQLEELVSGFGWRGRFVGKHKHSVQVSVHEVRPSIPISLQLLSNVDVRYFGKL
jgi:hypothetical protein